MVELAITPYDQEKQYIVKKHSSLIQSNNITTLQQRKAFNVMIFFARQELKQDPNLRIFTLDLNILRKLAGIKDTNLKNVKEALRSMQDLKIEYNVLGKDKEEIRESIVILPKVKIKTDKNTSLLSFEFPTDILEQIKNPKMYANLDLLIVRDLNSKYSLALYEILKDYINIGQLRINIKDLKTALGVDQNKGYIIYTSFNRRVLKPAIDEINEKTDLQVKYKAIKSGTGYKEIVFTMEIKQDKPTLINNLDYISIQLQQYWFNTEEILNYKRKYDDQYIIDNLEKAKKTAEGGKINNLKGYIITALNNDYRDKKTPYEIQQDQEKEKKKQEIQLEEDNKRKQQEIAKQEREKRQQKAIELLEEKGESFKQTMINEFKKDKSDFIITQIERYGIENPITNGMFLDFVYDYNFKS